MSPIGPERATSVTAADDVLRDVFGKGWVVRVQSPLALGEQSDPQPDIAVVAGSRRDYRKAHPTTAVLIVEVADTTVDYDGKVKASLYAKADIPDYWLLNIGAHRLEVYRDPQPDPTKPYGFGYATALNLKAGESIAPLAKPGAKSLVNDLLP